MNKKELEKKVIEALKTVFDPEIPVNVYELGLIYKHEVDENNNVKIVMTLTAPACPVAEDIINEVRMKTEGIAETNKVDVELTFEPQWDMSMMSEEAKLELGLS
ncbi:MAG: iron-sulfur cluster assembly protein [Bacteroidota bacterium]|nr:iron-sulfur cluster assembly protein [Bacteroidota bacterium]